MISAKQSEFRNLRSQIAIVGAGPAGSSLAIRLARKGLDVALIEKDRFPREKLCGEFISPECFRHFAELEVMTELFAGGGDRIVETRFFSTSGRSVSVPTEWFGHGCFALSLSRAQMDLELLLAAKATGVRVIEGARVVAATAAAGRMTSLDLRKDDGEKAQIEADLFIDASGRSAVLSKLSGQPMERTRKSSGLVGFKAHLSDVIPEPGVCEIYFFNGGYGGLSHVEGGKANFCFIVKADVMKGFIGNTNQLFRSVLEGNTRADQRMINAIPMHDWLAVAIDGFGRRNPSSLDNLVAVGDAGAFIDPFTGSGMLMALESAELLGRFIEPGWVHKEQYLAAHQRHFRRRLMAASVLRRAAFLPKAASAAIYLTGLHNGLRSALARATRTTEESA